MADEPDYTRMPAPVAVEGAVSSHDLAMADLRSWGAPELTRRAVEWLQARREFGLGKYDTVLHHANTRPHGDDALDEIGDLVAYLRTWLDQRRIAGQNVVQLADVYEHALWMLVQIAELAAGEDAPYDFERMVGPLTRHPEWPEDEA